jgi:heavy metal translocating P-type ATPase
VKSPAPSPSVDIAVFHPRGGQMRLVSRYFFGDPRADACQELLGKMFEVEEVRAVEILPAQAWAKVEYTNGVVPCREVVAKISRHLRHARARLRAPYVNSVRDLPVVSDDGAEAWRVERHGDLLSTWEIAHELPGRIRFRNRLIRRKMALCRAIDRAVTRLAGVIGCTTSPHTGSAVIVFDAGRVRRREIIRALDQALVDAEREGRDVPPGLAPAEIDLPALPPNDRRPSSAELSYCGKERPWSRSGSLIMGLSLGVAAIGALVFPPIGIFSVPGTLYVTRVMYASAWQSLKQGKLTVDVIAAGLHIASIAGGYYFLFILNSLVMLWARNLLDKIKRDSRGHYTDIFRQESRTAWIRVDGVEIETPLEAIHVGDLVAVSAGQTIPVDGRIAEGGATVDQHLLTGEAVPAEKLVGDPVFALTVVLSGKIYVRVEKTGAATAAAQIARVLDDTVDFKTGRQLRAERLADRLVSPTVIAGLATWPVLGPGAALGLMDAHPRYKTTVCSSLCLVTYFKLAAREGILIKDGRTLELLSDVDTVVFDKTGTLTLAQPHVARLYACAPRTATEILGLAAAAEQHQSHPLAAAILDVARARALPIRPVTEADYRVGYGLTVTVDGSTVRVGSMRFMETEAIAVPAAIADVQARCHDEGHSLVLVAIDGAVAGAIELQATVRPEARRIIRELRERHRASLYIISGDHEAPTRKLAEALGIEHYFAETLPEDKAALVARLQQEGKVVCYVGDGINDSIALKTSHVSVSLRGASTLATDTAEVILLDESLNQLPRVFDLAHACHASMKTTMAAVFVPSLLCVAGVLLLGMGFASARVFSAVTVATGLSAALLPLVTHRAPPAPALGAGSSAAPPTERAIEECVIS